VRADLVLISHDHFDHNCYNAVKGADSSLISKPVLTVEKGVRVEGIPADHDTDGGRRRGKITVFRFELDGVSFCHMGDIGHTVDEAMADKIGPVDVLFVPVGDTFTIGPQGARDVIDTIEPRIAIPMHYRTSGLSISIQPVQRFLDAVKGRKVIQVGNEVDFSREDLPDSHAEIWVFSL